MLDDAGKWQREPGLRCPGTFGILELPAKRFTVHRARGGSEVEIIRRTIGVKDRRGR